MKNKIPPAKDPDVKNGESTKERDREAAVAGGVSHSNLKDSQRISGVVRREADKPDVDELLDELRHFDSRVDLEKHKKRIPDCADGAMVSRCESGHRNFVPCRCKREWCEDCGDRHGYLNTRRYNQWIDRAKALYNAENVHSRKGNPCLAYWTITFPQELRHKLKDRDVLSELQSGTADIFKDAGYADILCCWHWQGEGGDECFWKPHLNLLVSDNYLGKKKFAELKREISGKLASLVNSVLDLEERLTHDDFNPYCELKKFPAQVGHCVSYVVRPTLRLGIDEDKECTSYSNWQIKRRYTELYNQVLRQYMNMRVYGSIRGSTQEETGDPVCGHEDCREELSSWSWCDRQWVEDVIVDSSLNDRPVKVGSVEKNKPPPLINMAENERVYDE